MKKTKLSSTLNKKLTSYAAVAGALAVTLSGCKKDNNDPLIMDVDLDPDVSMAPPAGIEFSQDIDFNGDGVTDVTIGVANYVYAPDNTDYGLGYATPQNGAEILVESNTLNFGTYTYTQDFGKALNSGDDIDASQTTWDGTDGFILGAAGTYYGFPLSTASPAFLGNDKYLGVRFPVSGANHYGWVRIELSNDGKTLTIKEYAHHSTAEAGLKAGDI